MRLRVSFVTNIPAPYRNHRYRRMAQIFPRYDLDFDVLYMAWTEPDRHWRFRAEELAYPHRVFAGLHPRVRGIDLHANPSLLWRLRRTPRDVVIVGGYNSPTHALAPFFCPAGSLKLLESESNPDSELRSSGPARWAKRFLVGRYDGYVAPGQRSRDLLARIDPASASKPCLLFPNLIDEAVYADGVAARRAERVHIRNELGVPEMSQLWVCPARLEVFKGLQRFLPLLEGLTNVALLVAGEGGLRSELEALIEAKRLPVRLLGQQGEAEMVRLYAAADLFVLPSLRDPSPLSPIEACAAQLPILASRRIGNVDDVVVEGENGWGFDPDDGAHTRDVVMRAAALRRDELARMGERSAALYRERFDSDRCIARLAEGLRELHARQRDRTH
jgi:glycosyltransferase involved in cell wall biosynthesis